MTISCYIIVPMDSWWSLGEGMGQFGAELSLYQIECAFCDESGNWELDHHAEKRKANGRKVINFDTYKCGSCAGYVMVLWSATEGSHGNHGLHNYKVLPWPLKFRPSDNWPDAIKRHWKQAHDNLKSNNYDAAVLMARSALQATMRDKGAQGRNLYSEIEDLANRGIITNIIKDWSHEVRLLATPAAHPQPNDEETDPDDARDIVRFLDSLLESVYDIPADIEKYRQRRSGNNPSE